MIYRVSYKMKTASKTVPVSEIFVKAFSESDAKRRAEENLDTRIYKVLVYSKLSCEQLRNMV